MAFFSVTFTFFDSDEHESTRTWYVEADDMADAEDHARDLITLISPMLAGGVRNTFQIAQNFLIPPLTGVKLTADPGSEVEIKAIFSMRRNFTGKATWTFPGLDKDAYTIPGGQINLTNTDVVALVNELVGFGWQDYRGGDYTGVISAEEGFG
jgi:hypothetical protein